MGKDNQDYFKRAGRSIGPAGPLRQFKAALSQERAVLRRDQEHRIPSERPVTGVRQAGWLHPPQGEPPQGKQPQGKQPQGQQPQGQPQGQQQGQQQGQGPTRPQARGGGPTPQGAGPKPAHPAQPTTTTSTAGRPERQGPRAPGSRAAKTDPAPSPREEHGGLAALESRNQEPPVHDVEPREHEAPYGFGIPASEEAALGGERAPHERLGRESSLASSRSRHPTLGETLGARMARRYPWPFRLLGRAAHMVERPVCRTLDRMHTLGEIAKRS